MDSKDFYGGIKTLSDWFGKKITDTQADIIFESVKHIPIKAWSDIVEKYTKRFKPNPSNFPTPEDINNSWYQWRGANPESVAKSFTQTDCSECFGRGLLPVRFLYEPLNHVYEKSYRCRKCENWKLHFNHHCQIPFMTRQELLEMPNILDIWPWKEME